jgi:AAA+ ATPase superfamily predicted ATPase
MPSPALLDRTSEMASLEQAWSDASTGNPQLVVLWGRRRVGKTFLLSHFVGDKRSVFFGATEQAEAVELARLSEAVRRGLGADAVDLAGGGFQSWEAALRYFAALARDEPLAVVLDEVPYLLRSTPGFASVVQAVWDHLARGTRLVLVMTGSAVGTIEGLLGAGGALRGRPTRALRLDPLDPIEARVFLPRLEPDAYFEAYAACGGYPLHLRQWDESATTWENLVRLAGAAGGILLEDALGILREELPDVGGYPRILAAIGRGRTRAGQIANEADQRIEHPLDVLVRAGLVRRSLPVGAPRRARPLYEIDDPYLAFWFAVLYADVTLIEAGQGRAVLRARLPAWQRHLGWTFEELARSHAGRLVQEGALPEDLVVGRWWAASGQPLEFDVLGLRGSRAMLVGEARWQGRPLGRRDVDALRVHASRLPHLADDPLLAFWSRGGVDVAAENVLSFTLEEALGEERVPG